MRIILADHVLPITAEPFTRGGVAIEGDRIAAVGTFDDLLSRFPNAELEDFGAAAVLPGFVNCHSHLELTCFRGGLDDVEHDFSSWLLRVAELRRDLADEDILRYAIAGAREGAAAGVTCFGDIGRNGLVGLLALKEAGLRGIVFQETEFSPDNRTADDDFAALAKRFETLFDERDGLVSVGLSPHSPYTVGSRLFELIAQYSIINRIPLSIHAAESDEETALMTKGEGSFRNFFERFDLEWESPHCTSIEYLERLGVLSARPLLAHCVKATETDIDRLASNRIAVAHCPKSNAKFGHGAAPLERFLDRDIAIGLGSDSVASNNMCDILEESRFAVLAARNRDDSKRFIGPAEALEMATLGGATALGMDKAIGSLEAGKAADIAIISLDSAAQQPVGDIMATLVFSSNARDVAATFVGGKPVYRR